jgi:hypothetical protein
MGSVSGMIWRWRVIASLVLIVGAGRAQADVTTERGSSVLIFPKVLFDTSGLQTRGPVDTIIQISNTSNSMVFAHCFYVNAAPRDPTRPAGVFNPPQWQEVDFDIWLTKQQPTHWVVGAGRREDPRDEQCSRQLRDCSDAGFDPGLVPPVPDPFAGELKCIQVDAAGAPVNGNQLKGEATIVGPDGDASKYNAIGILGLNTQLHSNNGDQNLCLGGGETAACPGGAEYNGCPQTVILDHFGENATDPVIEELGNGPSQVSTELTVVPCSEDFENQVPASVTVQFRLTNEFEELFSTSTTVTCWGNFRLDRIARVFDASFVGSRFVQTRMTAATDDQPGFVGIAEEFHRQQTRWSRAALNLHTEGVRSTGDVIVLPESQ